MRDALGAGQPLLVEVRVIAAEAASHLRFLDSPTGPHSQKAKDTVCAPAERSGYDRCRGIIRGNLAVAVIDQRGGLGPGVYLENIYFRGALRERVRILGAADLVAMCAARASGRREEHHAADALRGAPAAFSDYYRKRISMAVRAALASSLRSAGEVPPVAALVPAASGLPPVPGPEAAEE